MLRWVISIKTTTKIYFGQKTQKTHQSKKFDSTKHNLWTESCEGRGSSALGDTLNKALLISWIGTTLYYFRIVVNMLFIA